jgi:ABC-2 type transport system permease protein
MSIRKTLATSRRVLNQLRHDPRTVALMLLLPCVLLIILRYVFDGAETAEFDHIGPMLLGIFPLVLMFIVTSIVTLRERKIGTLDRLMTMPISKLDLVFGYALAFTLVAIVQALLAAGTILGLLGVTVLSGTIPILIAAVAAGFLGTSLGLFVSAFANSEFQAVQFMPAIIFPQLLTCGLFAARDHMARILQWFADIVPLTYGVDAMKQVTIHTTWTTTLTRDLVVVLAYGIAALILGAVTIRRQE